MRAVYLAVLVACGHGSTRSADDASRPGDGVVASTDAPAPALDATALPDGAPLIDASGLPDGMAGPDASALPDGAVGPDASSGPDAGAHADAGVDAMVAVDAGSTTPNTVSCYAQPTPTATCTLPTHCCFTNYDAQHNGDCTTAACSWGTISCDGPEDCASGGRCCAHAIIDPDQGLMGYTLACQAGPCGAAPANQELCHPGTCSSGTCVTALGHDNDLPRSLMICQ